MKRVTCGGFVSPLRYAYGVRRNEVDRFVAENRVVGDWVGKFEERTGRNNAAILCRFFKWLRLVKDVDLSPEELLDEHIVLRNSNSIGDRRRHLRWVLEFSRDNPRVPHR